MYPALCNVLCVDYLCIHTLQGCLFIAVEGFFCPSLLEMKQNLAVRVAFVWGGGCQTVWISFFFVSCLCFRGKVGCPLNRWLSWSLMSSELQTFLVWRVVEEGNLWMPCVHRWNPRLTLGESFLAALGKCESSREGNTFCLCSFQMERMGGNVELASLTCHLHYIWTKRSQPF